MELADWQRYARQYRLQRLLVPMYRPNIFLASDPEGREVVLKIGSRYPSTNGLHRSFAVAELTRQFTHQNLLSPHDVFRVEDKVVEVTRYLAPPWEPLPSYQEIAFDAARSIAVQIAGGLAHMHEHGLMHCDLRPQNVLYHPGTLETKIFDFNLACGPYCARKAGASRNSLPPEMLSARGEVTYSSDVWMAGHLVRGLTHSFAEARFARPNPDVPQEMILIIAKSIEEDPAKRYCDGCALLGALERL